MGPALGTILRRVRKNKHTRIIAITDNILPHEKRPGDVAFTRYFLRQCDAFITMSAKVMEDLRTFEKVKPAQQVLHPLYDNFGEPVSRSFAREMLRKTGDAGKETAGDGSGGRDGLAIADAAQADPSLVLSLRYV